MDQVLREKLLRLARWSIERWTADEDWQRAGPGLTSEEDQASDGLFVTLRHQERLRGCIGTVEANPSLDAELRRLAVQTASQDPRFPPVSKEELPSLTLSISLLSPPQPLNAIEEIVLGRDGLIIEQNLQRGLLLPEVPIDHGWDRERFLEELCRKAFLPPGAWRQAESRLYRFESEYFSEISD